MHRAKGAKRPPHILPTPGFLDIGRHPGLHERIHKSLVHAIVSGKFANGSKLPSEPDLATTFGVSRPVVRQALEKMREEGLVASVRGSGNYVRGLEGLVAALQPTFEVALQHAQGMLNDLEFRLVMEPDAAYLAALRRSPSNLTQMRTAMIQFEEAYCAGRITHHFDYLFHEAIAHATANERFVAAAREIEFSQNDERLLMRHIVHFQPNTRGAEVIREHGRVLDLIQQREAEAARRAMADHLGVSRQRLSEYFARLQQETPQTIDKDQRSAGLSGASVAQARP